MTKKSERLAVCFGVTGDLAFSAFVAMRNFMQQYPDLEVDFYLYTDRLSNKNRRFAKEFFRNLTIVGYKPPIPKAKLYTSKEISYFSHLVLSKFEAVNLLDKHKRVLWLDTDILLVRPARKFAAWDADIAYVPNEAPPSAAVKRNHSQLSASGKGLSAGLIYLRDSEEIQKISAKFLYEYVSQNIGDLRLPEQAGFDFALQNAPGLKKLHLSSDYCCNPREESQSTHILHKWGPNKFWVTFEEPRWNEIYSQLLAQGMGRFSPLASRLRLAFRKARYLYSTVRTCVLVKNSRSDTLGRPMGSPKLEN